MARTKPTARKSTGGAKNVVKTLPKKKVPRKSPPSPMAETSMDTSSWSPKTKKEILARMKRQQAPDYKPKGKVVKKASPARSGYGFSPSSSSSSPIDIKIVKKGAKKTPENSPKTTGPKFLVIAALMGDVAEVRRLLPKSKKDEIMEAYLTVKEHGSSSVIKELAANKYVVGYEAARTPESKYKVVWNHEKGEWVEENVARRKGKKVQPRGLAPGRPGDAGPVGVPPEDDTTPQSTKIPALMKKLLKEAKLPPAKKPASKKPTKTTKKVAAKKPATKKTPAAKGKAAKKVTAADIFKREADKIAKVRKEKADATAATKAKLLKQKGPAGDAARKLAKMSPASRAAYKKKAVEKIKIKQETEKKEAAAERARNKKRR